VNHRLDGRPNHLEPHWGRTGHRATAHDIDARMGGDDLFDETGLAQSRFAADENDSGPVVFGEQPRDGT